MEWTCRMKALIGQLRNEWQVNACNWLKTFLLILINIFCYFKVRRDKYVFGSVSGVLANTP